MIPGWPYSIIAALETGRSSWTAPVDAPPLAPGADVLGVTADQIRSAWVEWVGLVPVLEGTVIWLTVEQLPSGG